MSRSTFLSFSGVTSLPKVSAKPACGFKWWIGADRYAFRESFVRKDLGQYLLISLWFESVFPRKSGVVVEYYLNYHFRKTPAAGGGIGEGRCKLLRHFVLSMIVFPRKPAKPEIAKYDVGGFVLHAALQPQLQAIQQVRRFNITGGE